jgi:hypothetical protein
MAVRYGPNCQNKYHNAEPHHFFSKLAKFFKNSEAKSEIPVKSLVSAKKNWFSSVAHRLERFLNWNKSVNLKQN